MKRLAFLFVLVAGCSSPEKKERFAYDGCIHAHNDYLHTRPLYDALDAGACSVEADVHLVASSNLLVAHDIGQTDPSRTLQSLYLDPLRALAASNGGVVRDGGFTLLIDVKSDATATWPVVNAALAQYPELFTKWEGAVVTTGAVMAVISGSRDRPAMEAANPRWAAMDGRLTDLGTGAPVALLPLISDSWLATFTWFGVGPIPEDQRLLLEGYAAQAHADGRRIRFYSAPENVDLWREEAKAGVDLLSGDDLDALQALIEDETK